VVVLEAGLVAASVVLMSGAGYADDTRA
jgi:hypothetical protein